MDFRYSFSDFVFKIFFRDWIFYLCLQISDFLNFRFWILDFRILISEFECQFSVFRFWILEFRFLKIFDFSFWISFGFQILDYFWISFGFQILDYGSLISDFRFWMSDCGLWISDLRFQILFMDLGFQISDFEFQILDLRF